MLKLKDNRIFNLIIKVVIVSFLILYINKNKLNLNFIEYLLFLQNLNSNSILFIDILLLALDLFCIFILILKDYETNMDLKKIKTKINYLNNLALNDNSDKYKLIFDQINKEIFFLTKKDKFYKIKKINYVTYLINYSHYENILKCLLIILLYYFDIDINRYVITILILYFIQIYNLNNILIYIIIEVKYSLCRKLLILLMKFKQIIFIINITYIIQTEQITTNLVLFNIFSLILFLIILKKIIIPATNS